MNREQHLILHGLAIKKYATAEAIAGIIGVDPAKVATILADTEARGLVLSTQGRSSLTPIGRVALTSDYSRHCADLRQNPEFLRAYEDFEAVNGALKALITRWQVIEVAGSAIANDHQDKDYDEKVIDALGDLHEHADQVLERMAEQLPRLSVYREKLQKALDQAEEGAIEWVSDAKIESYHTLWFELHEDLLCMLGRQREE